MSSVRLVTFNVHHGVGDDGRHDLARIARLLEQADADLICLQEVDRHFGRRSEHVDQARLLAEALDRELVWSASIDQPPTAGHAERRQYGNAVLSRLPVRDHEVHRLPGGGEPRSAVRVAFETSGGPLQLVATHLASGSARDRAAQLAAVVELAAGPGPWVLAGDLNADAGAPELAALRGRFADAWVLAAEHSDQAGRFSLRGGRGLTHPARRPRVRIDQVWVSPGVAVSQARVLDGATSSDHHPLQVDLELRPSPAPGDAG